MNPDISHHQYPESQSLVPHNVCSEDESDLFVRSLSSLFFCDSPKSTAD